MAKGRQKDGKKTKTIADSTEPFSYSAHNALLILNS